MAWGQRTRKIESGAIGGVEINAGRVRAAIATPGQPPRAVAFASAEMELSLALNIGVRPAEVGAKALNLRRTAPHQLCIGFLPFLGQPRVWSCGRNRLDATAALGLIAERLRVPLAGLAGYAVVWPAYLTPAQVELANSTLDGTRIPLLGSCPTPLALATQSGRLSRGTALVLDADDHALTWSVLSTDPRQVTHHGSLPLVGLGLRAWVDRLMGVVADRCIRLCRRDPRDSAIAEQSLDDQLSAALAQPRTNRPWSLSIRTEHWFQNLTLAPDEIERGCSSLARTAADGLRQALAELPGPGPAEVLWVTSSAAHLPGLLSAVGVRLPERTAIEELAPTAAADAAHALALRRLRGDLAFGHLDGVLPREPPDSERLHTR